MKKSQWNQRQSKKVAITAEVVEVGPTPMLFKNESSPHSLYNGDESPYGDTLNLMNVRGFGEEDPPIKKKETSLIQSPFISELENSMKAIHLQDQMSSAERLIKTHRSCQRMIRRNVVFHKTSQRSIVKPDVKVTNITFTAAKDLAVDKASKIDRTLFKDSLRKLSFGRTSSNASPKNMFQPEKLPERLSSLSPENTPTIEPFDIKRATPLNAYHMGALTQVLGKTKNVFRNKSTLKQYQTTFEQTPEPLMNKSTQQEPKQLLDMLLNQQSGYLDIKKHNEISTANLDLLQQFIEVPMTVNPPQSNALSTQNSEHPLKKESQQSLPTRV